MNVKDTDLDAMNIIRGLPDQDNAFYFRTDGKEGFHYYKGTICGLGEALGALMEQDDNIYEVVLHAVEIYQDEE